MKDIQELAESLVGTSGSYDESFAKFYGVDVDDLEELLEDFDER